MYETLVSDNNVEKRSNKANVFIFTVVIMMYGSVYLFPLFKSLNMGEVIILIVLPFLLSGLVKMPMNRSFKWLFAFMLYSTIISINVCITFDGNMIKVITRLSRDFFYYLIIIVGAKYFNLRAFKKMVITFCTILCTFVIAQVVVFYLFDYFIPGLLLNAYVNDANLKGVDLYNSLISYANLGGYLKPNGFLCEPAHCAHCFFVAIMLLLFDDDTNRHDFMRAIYISFGMSLTMSTSAFLYLFFVWGIWSIINGKRKTLEMVTLVCGALLIGGVMISTGKFDKIVVVIQRFSNSLLGTGIISNSAQLRLFKGFVTFYEFPFWGKVFGIGFGNYTTVITRFMRGSSINMIESEYMSTISYILVSVGMMGFLIFACFIIHMYRTKGRLARTAILGLIVSAMGASIYSSPVWVWMIMIILYSDERKRVPDGRCYNLKLC